ncbi:helix-turn-helix domain-containing protein [Arthrobacter sp. M4]|uniref:ArsR/SmtB family transcription factor n=1 Tax=Arthrobacter sp. M4 TaxID=218160 RepID=UPI001CDBFCA5|nr:helix-turn-helix domain-containing protein [Arthrobacter sp. M4]
MNPARSLLVRFLITHGPATCTEIAAALHVASPTIRRHLALLSSAGIVKHIRGQFKAQPDAIRRQLDELAALFQPAGNDPRNRATEPSHFSTSPFHSSEWPGTSNRTS